MQTIMPTNIQKSQMISQIIYNHAHAVSIQAHMSKKEPPAPRFQGLTVLIYQIFNLLYGSQPNIFCA